jgi:hypothetical protein
MNQQDIAQPNQPATPASNDEIPGLARVEKIATDPHVRAASSGERQPFSSPPPSEGTSRIPKNTLLADFVGGLLNFVARILNPALVERCFAFAKNFGHFAVFTGAGLTAVYAIVVAIKENSFASFATGLAIAVALAVAQFVATKFLGAADTTIATTPSRVASPAFLECVGLIALLAAAGLFVTGLVSAIRFESIAPFVPALLFSLSLTFFGAVALHPQIASVSVGQGSAGEEAIGLLSFFFKAWLKLVPVYFFLLATAGALTVLMSLFGGGQMLTNMAQGLMAVVPMAGLVPPGFAGSGLVLMACLLPLGAYFIFLLQYLVLDVIRAVLVVPAKLDALKR